MSGSRRSAIVAAAALAAVAWARPARADDDLVVKQMRFAERSGTLVVTTRFPELFDREAYRKLGSGLTQTLLVRAYVYAKGEAQPVAYRLARIRVVYDLWDEVYRIRVEDDRGRRTRRARTRARARDLVSSLSRFPIADLADIPYEDHHYLGLVIELNPVSKETLAEMRRWLTKRPGQQSLDRGTSFFGSVVSVFVNPKLPDADRVMKIRSQPFYRPRPDGREED